MSRRGPWPVRRRMRLRTKLIAVSLLLLAFVGAGIAVVSYLSMETYLTGQLDLQLRRSAHAATDHVPDPGQPGGSGAVPPNPLQAPGQGEGILMMRVTDGVVDTARSGWIDLQYQQHVIGSADVAALRALTPGASPSNVDLGIGAYRVESLEASDGSIVTVGLPLGTLDGTLSSLGLTMALVAAAGLLAAGVAGTVLIRHNLKPLEEVSTVANRIAELHLDSGEVELVERIEPSDNDTEVGRVGNALNRMLDNLSGALSARQESESKVRRFVADASHELRTPLASIRGYSDLVVRTQKLDDGGRDSMDRVRSQALRMQNLVDDLLLLARYDEGRPPALADLDLTELVVEAATDAEIADAAASARTGTVPHRWNIDVPAEAVMVRGDESQLHRAVANLLSNAKKHTDPGTSVTVVLETRPEGTAAVTVRDCGKGMDAAFLPRIFDRFARADTARSGTDGTTGLGLPIVKAIVEAHGGTIAVASGPSGTEFTIALPAARP
ncbi:two-component system OmpR family sensor kinase [Arthrobacter silviterrae]|uniref:histidine kinase n=1 Tax=Arthrobacter silviterrae TaxID=2026658 RepID=A0ABX0D629_9MICC|nr:HAMP domain-containing sensor histidine kinase [Arthrobacter silviterrae]MDQ0278393.1 two-component system OmpR family sensor kinase [Arthrobacter silviterrae]NGN82348.1 HAMP domain-containing histidine kinase [Arthrobacter silviterrae]